MFTVTIELGNAAMQDVIDVREALEEIDARLADGDTEGKVVDGNGNTVGSWKFAPDTEGGDDE